MHYIIIDKTRAIGIGNENAELVLLFTEHTTREIGESVCRFLNGMEDPVLLTAGATGRHNLRSISGMCGTRA